MSAGWLFAWVWFGAQGALASELTVTFPPGFKWCVATAAHQIEGYNSESDLWDWEQVPGHVKNGDKSGPACDSWNRFELDAANIQSLGAKLYRLSVEWAKLEPEEGHIDLGAVLHYRAVLASLRAHGIEPMVTLHHFTLPRWLRAKGGWEWEGAPAAFAGYTELVYKILGDQVRDWVTFNEPMVHLLGGYLTAQMPPGEKRELADLVPVLRGMLRAHALAYVRLHTDAQAAGRPVRVGIAHHLRTMDPWKSWNPLDLLGSHIANQAWNWTFGDAVESGRLKFKVLWKVRVNEEISELAAIGHPAEDFIGVNYYTGDLIHFSLKDGLVPKTRKKLPKNDLGWDIYPEGFYRVLTAVHSRWPDRPVIITENGIADRGQLDPADPEEAARLAELSPEEAREQPGSRDPMRQQYLRDHLTQLARAMSEGVPVEGYCHWSLMDNFEWIEGFAPKFGLYRMLDYSTTFRRKRRQSADLFESIARNNGF